MSPSTLAVPAGRDLAFPPGRPVLDVVIPVFNMADTIGRCLESITALDYDPEAFEVIVVDNMSTDDTRQIVAKFPVRVLEEKVFQSSYAARNTGIAAARGKLIAFTDADCVAAQRRASHRLGGFAAGPAPILTNA